MTPGRIASVIEKLEKLQEQGENFPNRMVGEELDQIAREVQAIKKDLDPDEGRLLDKQLEIRGLAPVQPGPIPIHEERSVVLRRQEKDDIGSLRSPPPDRKKRLRYHTRFAVGEHGEPRYG
jgi:hypothetical protein